MSMAVQHLDHSAGRGGGAEEYYEEYEEVTEYYDDEEEHEYLEELVDDTYVDIAEAEEGYYDEPPGGDMAAIIAAAASKRQTRMDQGGYQMTEPNQNEYYDETIVDEEEEDVPEGGMAAMIAAAATQRKDRLDQGGEQKVTHIEPAPNQGMDMTAMIAHRAKTRNERIKSGGDLKVRDVPKVHKTVFSNVALEAARMGTLTRLDEHTVVAVAGFKEEEVWKGPSGLRTDHVRSTMFMAVNEAAAMGAMRKLKPVEVTNYDQNAYHEEEELEDVDKMMDDDGRRVVRQKYLIDRRIDEERKYKAEEWSAENAANIVQYNSMDEVALPSESAPKWKPKQTKKSHRELMDSISHGVAERAWERNYRLGRPKALLQMTRKCKCKFCVNPNPYQTHKYKEMEEEGIEKTKGPLLDTKEEDKKATKAWTPTVKQTRNVRPGEWSESSSYTPLPTAVPKYTPTRAPRKPIVNLAAAPAPVPVALIPESEPEGDNGVFVLLDETTTWGHTRERTKKPKKDKKKSSSSKKKKKSHKKSEGGCSIM